MKFSGIMNITNNPSASIVMITYRHENYIKQAIDGVLMQNVNFPIELIIANDNSPDNTDFIVKNLLKDHPKSSLVKYINHEENKGMMSNFIFALKQCKGDYIAICEGDDYWTDPLKLQKQVDFLESNPEYVITYTDIQPFDSNGEIKIDFGGTKRDLEALDLKKCACINTLTSCFRNVLTDFPHEMKHSAYGDLFVWSLLGDYGKGKYLDTIKPSRYRVHGGGVHSKKSKKERLKMQIKTNRVLYNYYKRINNIEISNHFMFQLIKNKLRLCFV